MSFIKIFSDDVQWLFFAVTLISLFITFRCCYIYSVYPILAMFIYVSRFFFFRELGILAATMAGAIILLSYKYIIERKLGKFIIIVIMAASFHNLAFLFLPIYFLYKYKMNGKFLFITVITAVLFGEIFPIKEVLMDYLAKDMGIPYIGYVYSENMREGFNPMLIWQTSVLFVFWLMRKELIKKYEWYNLALWIQYLSVMCLASLNQIVDIAGRVSTAYASIGMLILPAMLANCKYSIYRGLFFLLILILAEFVLKYFGF